MMQVVIAREDVTRTKPDPEPYRRASEYLRVAPELCLALEDTPTGIASARASGMFVVCWPNELTRNLNLRGANLIVNSLVELPWREMLNIAAPHEHRLTP
jgi:beta-phosphoglucomutase-like phosphatase (HAD superfamily)